MKKDANFWSEHALSMDIALPHHQPHIGDPSLGEKTPKKRRRKKEDKEDKPDKPSTGKKRGRKPKSSKLGSAGSQDPGGTPGGEYYGHDWTSPSSVMANPKIPGMAERFGDMPNPLVGNPAEKVGDHLLWCLCDLCLLEIIFSFFNIGY